MKRRILMVASMGSMISQFNIENLTLLKKMGFNIEVACNLSSVDPMSDERRDEMINFFKSNEILYHHINFDRGIGTLNSNIKNYNALLKLCSETHFDVIHTHSPLASVITRFVAKKLQIPVIYTAHGFQFFKGGKLKDWILYYPVERYLSKYTDCLVTINNEDFSRAKKMKAGRVVQIPGVGIDYYKYSRVNRDKRDIVREKLGISETDILLISVGELSSRKNHQVIIEALSKIKNKNIKLVICGVGSLNAYLIELTEQHDLKNFVKFLGYRQDVDELMQASDIFVFPSVREGLGLAGIEAMASGLPIITSNVNGIKDYSQDGISGYMYPPHDVEGFARGISSLAKNETLRQKMGKHNSEIAKKFDKSNTRKIMKNVYSRYLH